MLELVTNTQDTSILFHLHLTENPLVLAAHALLLCAECSVVFPLLLHVLFTIAASLLLC